MANLFGKNKLRGVAQQIVTAEVMPFIEIVREWHEDYHNGSLKRDKETSREQEYNQQFFKTILGYKEKPASPFSFEPKATTDKGQLPDAVIGYTDTANELRNIAAVVELKGAAIDLDRPQRREGNFSPVQQGFKYKTQYRSVPFVIVSNFWEFRLYHDNLLDYEVWTLDDLVDPTDDYILFKTWYALLRRENFTTSKGTSKTENLLSDIRVEQDNISKNFYKVYREARLELLRDIYQHNNHIRTNIDIGIEKAQKIVDRIVFAAFAEDSGLLPDNTLLRVIKAADSSAFGGSLWNTLKGFFEAIDVGSDRLEIPDGYNGGLFKRDDKLDSLHISDEPLRKVLELGAYNFAEDLSVNILGHIFEQSISDLEEIKNKVNESQNVEAIGQSRRKKDGIFYTPDYIVRYIVDNSLGSYLREHEERFKDEFGLKGDIKDTTYEKREKQAYAKYQDFLQNVKVLDPACGSGAFLVYVFDYLLAENKRVTDILGNSLFSSENYVRDILRNNIYGVDLNEESVEITKLSLWLKTAQKGKKLTTLDANIKCGNSLIDDPNIADSKAFNWQGQFADVFKHGGFDVVVMNPPYVDSEAMTTHIPEQRNFLAKNYENTTGNWDLYIPFIELSMLLVKDGGYSSFITPDKWIAKPFGESTRKNFMPYITRIAFAGREVFSDAKVDSIVTTLHKKPSQTITALDAKETDFPLLNEVDKDQIQPPYTFDFLMSNNLPLISKVEKNVDTVSSYALCDGACATSDAYKLKDLVEDSPNPLDGYMRMINTGTVGKFVSRWGYSPMTYLGEKYLNPVINKRRFENDFGNSYYRKSIQPKLIIKGLTLLDLSADFNAEVVPGKSTLLLLSENIENLRFLLVLLNSRFPLYFIKQKYSASSYNGGITFTKDMIGNFPIPNISKEIFDLFVKRSYEYMDLYTNLQISSDRFQKIVMQELRMDKFPSRLNHWWTLDLTAFLKAVGNKLSLTQKDEFVALYDKYRSDLLALHNEIQKIDLEVNQLVYQLYDLTPDEVAIVEEKK